MQKTHAKKKTTPCAAWTTLFVVWCRRCPRPDSLTRWETLISIMCDIILVLMLISFKKHFDWTLRLKLHKTDYYIYIIYHFSSIGINYWPTINTTVEWKLYMFAIIIQAKELSLRANLSSCVFIYEKLIIVNGIWLLSTSIWRDAGYYTILSVISAPQ